MVAWLLLSLLAFFAVLHALGAGWLTFVGPRARLWERLALMSTLVTMVMGLALVVLAFTVRHFESDALMLLPVWAGALVLEAGCVVALRRASPRVAAGVIALALVAIPLWWVIEKAVEVHHRRTHWNCVQHVFVKRSPR